MGWDVTYHPVGGDEIESIYFATLAAPGREAEVVKQFGLDPFYAERMREVFAAAREF